VKINQIVAFMRSLDLAVGLKANGPAIKLVGVAERVKAVTTKFSSA